MVQVQDPFDRLVSALYDTAVDPKGWGTFLEVLSAEFTAGLVGFVHQDVGSKRDAVNLFRGVDEAALQEYEQHWAPRNVWIAGAADRIVSGIVMTGQMMCPDRTLRRSEMWNEFFRAHDAFHLIGGCIFRTGTSTGNFTIIRSETLGPYGEADLAMLRRLMPHLQRAVRIHTRLAGVERGTNPIAEVADKIGEAFLLLDAEGRVLFANRAAEEILAERDGLSWDGKALAGARPAVTAALRRLARSGDGTALLPRPSGREALLAVAAPIAPRHAGAWIADQAAAAVLFIRDPARQQQASEDLLARAYGLTPAEARLAAALSRGLRLEEFAVEQNVSLNTVRTQLRAVFDKTGTHRQADLVRLALGTAMPVRSA